MNSSATRQDLIRNAFAVKKVGISLPLLLQLLFRHWKWFLLSMALCLAVAYLHIWRTTPVYRVSARMLIKQPDSRIRTSNMTNVQTSGMVSNTSGIEEELEKIWSTTLVGDVVRRLKLYTEYSVDDWPKSRQVYARQPVTVDLDPFHLDSLNEVMYSDFNVVRVKMSRRQPGDSTLYVRGILQCNGRQVGKFSRKFTSLPASIDTPFGTLTFTKNPDGEPMSPDHEWSVSISPPTFIALRYMGRLKLNPVENKMGRARYNFIQYFRKTYVAQLSLADINVRRATDFLNQIVVSYNLLATRDKDEIAMRTEEFVNERIARLSEELGTSDDLVSNIKQSGGMAGLGNASQAVSMQNQLSASLTEASAQLQLLDYLGEYMDAPENRYAVIPSSTGLTDAASTSLIDRYNQTLQERNRLLKSATENAPQVELLTSTVDELRASVNEALQIARQSTIIQRDGLFGQYAKFSGRISRAPTVEHALSDEGRQQMVKSKLYQTLLQIREENSITLASSAENGQLVDEPLCEGKVSPRPLLTYGIALGVGIAIPYLLMLLLFLLRYKISSSEEVAQLTDLPVIADIPQTENAKKTKAGIVVQANRNEPIDEVFRLLRTNIFFMLQESQHTILFTSTTAGEGKTFIAANLAVSYATMGKRVILCGIDIRKPALGALFGLKDHSAGLTKLLGMDVITADDVQHEIGASGIDENLHLLMAGPIPPNPTELLARNSFGQVISILKDSYDYVILDTAPVGLVTDTLQIARYADVSVYVCRVGYTPKRDFSLVNRLHEEQKLPNLCVVVNGSQG